MQALKKKERDKLEKELIIKIDGLEKKLKPDNVNELENYRNELINIRKQKMQGHLIRSRATIIEEDEKPTQYFCKLESYNNASKIIPKLEQNDGSFLTNQVDILNQAKLFYQQLYSSKDDELIDVNLSDDFLNISNDIPKLDAMESNNLEGLITYEQASVTLKAMKNGKSPGSSGYNCDFYKVFWGKLGHFVVRSINAGFIKGELSISQKLGIITCIPKENKSRFHMKNYRPISLLNCVYKIASGCIANRIKSTLNKLIHSDQTGFIAGRYIGENTRLLYDIMQITEEKNLPGLLLLIDFEKAFDSISWKFINKVLKYFGFGDSIISWVNLFYKNAMLSVNQGGNLSSFFQIGRGCRQGDPLSPYIFILCSEILAIKIRNNKDIKGITIGKTEYKLSQYADDTSAILDGSEKSLTETLKELSYFSKYSGLKVNFDKTQVVWIGCKKYSSDSIKTKWKLNWGKTEFKLLGITFNVDLDEIIKVNYDEKIAKIKKLIKLWQCRYITPLGRLLL